MNICITAIIKAKSEYLAEVKSILQDMVIQSRQESACIQYDLHQGIEDETTFVFHEIWENKEGLDVHDQKPYLRNFGAIVAEKLQRAPVVLKMTKI